jgi:hypothetical protein
VPERGNRYAYLLEQATANPQGRTTAATAVNSAAVPYNQFNVDCFKLAGGVCTTQVPAVPTAVATGAGALTVAAETGVTGIVTNAGGTIKGPSGSFLAHALGNVDNDASPDHWWIGGSVSANVAAATCADTQNGVSGTPVNQWNDVNCD